MIKDCPTCGKTYVGPNKPVVQCTACKELFV